jgi:regulatory protein
LTLVPDPSLVPSPDEPTGESRALADSAEADPGAESSGQGQRRGGRRPRAPNASGADRRAGVRSSGADPLAAGEDVRSGDAGPWEADSGGATSGGAEPWEAGSGHVSPGAAEPGSEEAARAICLRLLTAGPRTRAQLATALRKRRIPDEVAESVLSRFTEVGLIDDAAFARAWVESRHHGRGLARRALRAELRQRGIPDGDVRSAVGLLGPQDELATARRLVAKRLPASQGKPAPARARQLMGMLARKGYSAGLAAQVVREALEQEQESDAGHGADLAWISEDGAGDDWL